MFKLEWLFTKTQKERLARSVDRSFGTATKLRRALDIASDRQTAMWLTINGVWIPLGTAILALAVYITVVLTLA